MVTPGDRPQFYCGLTGTTCVTTYRCLITGDAALDINFGWRGNYLRAALI